jgi:hypothetical protein
VTFYIPSSLTIIVGIVHEIVDRVDARRRTGVAADWTAISSGGFRGSVIYEVSSSLELASFNQICKNLRYTKVSGTTRTNIT